MYREQKETNSYQKKEETRIRNTTRESIADIYTLFHQESRKQYFYKRRHILKEYKNRYRTYYRAPVEQKIYSYEKKEEKFIEKCQIFGAMLYYICYDVKRSKI